MYPIESVGQKCRHNKPAMTDTTIMHASFGTCSSDQSGRNQPINQHRQTQTAKTNRVGDVICIYQMPYDCHSYLEADTSTTQQQHQHQHQHQPPQQTTAAAAATAAGPAAAAATTAATAATAASGLEFKMYDKCNTTPPAVDVTSNSTTTAVQHYHTRVIR